MLVMASGRTEKYGKEEELLILRAARTTDNAMYQKVGWQQCCWTRATEYYLKSRKRKQTTDAMARKESAGKGQKQVHEELYDILGCKQGVAKLRDEECGMQIQTLRNMILPNQTSYCAPRSG